MRWPRWRACFPKRQRALCVLIISLALLFSFLGGSLDVPPPLTGIQTHCLNSVDSGQPEDTGGAKMQRTDRLNSTQGAKEATNDGANGTTPPLRQCTITRRSVWIDCHPEAGADKQTCLSRNCCWNPHPSGPVAVYQPCLMPFDSRRYVFWELLYDDHGEYVALGLNDSDAELRGDSKQLKVDFTKVAYHTARLRIRDPTTREFEPLLPQVSPGQLDPILNYVVSHKSGIFTLRSESVPGQSFGVYLRSIIYTNGTRQVVIKIPSARLFYGLQGRHGAPFVNASQWSRHAFYGADSVQTRVSLLGQPPFLVLELSGLPYSTNVQRHMAKEGMFSSVHPFVVIATNNSNITLGLFLLNSNDVVMTLSPARLVTFRTSGGILDLFFFFGPDPQSVVRQYLRVVGYPAMPLPALLLRGPHTKGVPILDGSFTSGSLPPTHPEVGLANSSTSREAVIRDTGGQPYRCRAADQGNALIEFADFTHKLSSQQWPEIVQQQLKDVSLYLNTVVLLRNPRCAPNTVHDKSRPVDVSGTARLQQSTYAEVRNAYTTLLARETFRSFAKRFAYVPMLLSKRSFPGMGSWGGYWNSRLLSMESAVQGMLVHSILGMPVYGVATCHPKQAEGSQAMDRCGDWGARPSAFFLLRRPEKGNSSGNVMGPEALPESNISEVVPQEGLQHVTLLPYTMTMLLRCSRDGDMLARPMFFDFPHEPRTHSYPLQFMYGPHLLVAPQAVPPKNRSAELFKVYLPRGVWYNASDGRQLVSNGQRIYLEAHKGLVEAVFTRGGSIVPLSTRSQSNYTGREISLLVSLDADGRASGEFRQVALKYMNLSRLLSGRYSSLHFDFIQSALIGFCSVCMHDTTLVGVRIYGLRSHPTSIDINGRPLRFSVFPRYLEILDVNYTTFRPFIITLA